MGHIESSGIRKIFDLARSVEDPINLSIGQPDFDVPQPIKAAAEAAMEEGRNGYTQTAGLVELRQRLRERCVSPFRHEDREVTVTSGSSGGLVLALCCTVNPGDEVIVFDPYFVSYPHMVALAGGRTVFLDTYPDFDIDPDRVRSALTPRTKAVIVNSPCNPSGRVLARERLRDLARLCQQRGVLLLSDEVYRVFCYDEAFASPAEFNSDVLVLDGFSKAYGMTGWRLGFAHGPRRLIEEMNKLQQVTYVCAPSMVQYAGLAALDFDVTELVAGYQRKRDFIYEGLKDRYDIVKPEGAFYLFPRAPGGDATAFVGRAIQNKLLCIPGGTFSQCNSHFRLSYAADDRTLQRGVEVLNRLAH
jgi:aspartate aminotransferase/aminotransferase